MKTSWKHTLVGGVILGCAVPLCAAEHKVAPTPAPAQTSGVSKPDPAAAKAAALAIANAAKALSKEYADYLQDSTKTVRTASDYFKDNASPDVTPDAVLLALGKMWNSDPRIDAYIKWQLLSAVTNPLESKQADDATGIYRSLVLTFDRPGLSAEDKRMLDVVLSKVKLGGEDDVNKQWNEHVTQVMDQNEPEVQYRNALLERLPANYKVILAEFKDAYERASHGVGADRVVTHTGTDVENWIASGPQADQAQSLAQTMDSLINLVGGAKKADAGGAGPSLAAGDPGSVQADVLSLANDSSSAILPCAAVSVKPGAFPPSYYSEIYEDDKTKTLHWRAAQAKFFDVKTLESLKKDLADAINPATAPKISKDKGN